MQEPVRNRSPETRRIDWPGILRILLAQVLVLLALSVAFIRYVEWSSERAWQEFSRAAASSAPAATPQRASAGPLQPVKDNAACEPKP